MKTKLQHAVSLANMGFCIFPLSVNSKVPPAGLKWRDESTGHIPAIEKWWTENPDCNIGIDTGKSGVYVIDIDVKEGKKGAETFDKLNDDFGFPDTLTAITASGGEHWIYKSPADHLGNTAGALGDGIDTRGWGGYIVGAGSTIDSKAYGFDDSGPMVPAPLPDWVAEKLHEYRAQRQQSNRQDKFSEDSLSDIERYRIWLSDVAELAIQGHNGDHTTFATAAKGREFGLSADTVLQMLLDHWNDRCSPPWQAEELQRKVENAFKYANKAQGAASASADFGTAEEQPEVTFDEMASGFLLPAESSIPKRKWAYGRYAIRGKVSVLTSSAGAGKSTLMMTVAVSKATGRDLLGISPCGRGAVMVQNNEDDMEELQRRMVAICKYHSIGDTDLLDNDAKGGAARPMLHMQSGEIRPLRIAQRAGASLSIKPLDADKLVAYLIAHNIEMVIVDPFSETHPANENDNGEMQEVAKIYRYVAQKANCAVILVHHDRKPDKASADGHIGNMNSSRGASSLSGVARVMFTFHTITEKDAKRFGIPENERFSYARLDFAKANMSPTMGEPLWFRRIDQRINADAADPDRGEGVGVVANVKLISKQPPEESAMMDMINDVESEVIDAGAEGVLVVSIAESLTHAYPAYMGKNKDTLARSIQRLFSENEAVLTAKGVLIKYTRDRRKGEPVSSPLTYVRWQEKPESK